MDVDIDVENCMVHLTSTDFPRFRHAWITDNFVLGISICLVNYKTQLYIM